MHSAGSSVRLFYYTFIMEKIEMTHNAYKKLLKNFFEKI